MRNPVAAQPLPHEPAVGAGGDAARLEERRQRAVEAAQELIPPGIIGPFALETFYHPNTGFTVFEISGRIVAGTNPFGTGSEYSIWTYGKPVSTGRRIAMEIKSAIESKELDKIVS